MNSTNTNYSTFLLLLLPSFLSTLKTSNATDTINISQTLRDNINATSSLISSNGKFELGFFSPDNSKNRYLGIWYNKLSSKTVVWVANRNDPLRDGSGALKVVKPGLLLLLDHTNATIWSTNASRNVRNPVAVLLDSGNLVVKDEDEGKDDNHPVWQSFDYPTDTLLPGMKLGWNFTTGHEVYLTAWKSIDDPASGDYTYHCDPSGYPQNVLKNGTFVHYKTGPWNGVHFSGSQIFRENTFFTFGMVITERDVYNYFELLNDSVSTRFTVSDSGDGQRWLWMYQSWVLLYSIPVDYCDNYRRCGAYGVCSNGNGSACGCLNEYAPRDSQGWAQGDWSQGCVRRTALNCVDGDAFLKYSRIKLPDSERSWYNESMNLDECKMLCRNNCSCTAYASLNISNGGSGCLQWFGELVDMREMSPGQEIYIRMASSELGISSVGDSRVSGQKKRGIHTVTLSLVIGIPLLCLSLFLCIWQRKRLNHQKHETGREMLNYADNHRDEGDNKDLELPLFDITTITGATDNLSMNNKLGEGGFGPVYKGVLEDGQEIAVKCLSRTSHQGITEFKNEVVCIAKLQHRNLVRLVGWCIHGEEMMLVYEYCANKSLDLILFDPTKSILLDWPRRSNIIKGIARGLMYLHQDSRLRVIHRDLKASNILLDSDMNPKISDFGLARTFGGNETGADTSRIVGTYGYMSPEYAVDGVFSVKSDVFSYGVIVLEIVSGKRNRGFSHRDHLLNLLGHAWMLYKEEGVLEMVDTSVQNPCYLSEVVRSIHIGLLCVQERAEDRPSMSNVVMMQSNDSVLPEPKHPGFFTARDPLVKTETSVSSDTASATNTMSITLVEPR